MIVDVSGPIGGAIATAYALGCASGWGFNMRLMVRRVAELRRDCEKHDAEQKAHIARLEGEVDKLNGFMMRGMERQLDQMHDSTVRMIDRGRITPPLGEAE